MNSYSEAYVKTVTENKRINLKMILLLKNFSFEIFT